MKKNALALALATVCVVQGIAPNAVTAQQVPRGAIRVGDLLRIEVQSAPELSQNVQVDTEGNIFFPGVPGAIRVVDLTTGEAAARVNSTFQSIGLRDPRIQLSKSGSRYTPLGAGRTETMVTEIIPLYNSDAQELSESLQGMTSPGGNLSYHRDANALIVTDNPAAVQSIITAVNRLDQMQSQLTQVRIEAKIAEVRVGALKELGINWFVQGNEGIGGFNPLTAQDPALISMRGIDPFEAINTGAGNNNRGGNNSAGGGGSGIGFVEETFKRRLAVPIRIPLPGQSYIGFTNAHVDIGAMLDALVIDNKAILLANPMTFATNNRPSEIKMVDEFPYTQFSTQINGATTSTTEFIEMGITLKVTPHVYQDRVGPYVELDILAEVSFPIGSSNGVPIRSLRSLSNRASVRDNQTLVIGGILREDERTVDSKVPGLGNLPLLGRLFRKEEDTKFRSELMIFVTPTIYRHPEDITWDRMIDISENLRAQSLIPIAAIRGEARKN